MKAPAFAYAKPASLGEVFDLLERHGRKDRLVPTPDCGRQPGYHGDEGAQGRRLHSARSGRMGNAR